MPLITGTDGPDTLRGGEGNDTLRGLAGHDRLLPGDGADLVEGGEGNDEINGYLTDPGSGRFGFSYFVVSGAKTLRGGQGDDVIIGGSSGDSLLGEDGQDFLAGLEGDDTLDGGAGINRLDGGPGNDLYRIRSIDTVIVDEGGTDTLEVGISHAKVPSWIEKITYVDGAQPLPYWIDALLPDSASGRAFTQLLDASRTLRYAFPSTLPAYNTDAEDANGYAPFTAVQQERAVAALQGLSAILNLQFAAATDVAATGVLAFANNQQQGSSGYAIFPNRSSRGSDLFFDVDGSGNDRFASGTYAALTLIHEIAHALGLEHPFSSGDSDPPHLGREEDRTAWTVMSYEDSAAEYDITLRELDIAALQYLYGPSPRARTGADVYTVNPLEPNFIWDGAGVDTLDASALSVPVVLSLEPGFWGYAGAARGSLITQPAQVTVNFGSVIERLTGSAQADQLLGNSAANTIAWGAGDDRLTGAGGNDRLDGGAGRDVALFSGALKDYTVRATGSGAAAALAVTDSQAARDGQDTLLGVERLQFADKTLNLTVQASHAAVPRAVADRIGELYVAFFNRVPDADGLEYWLQQFQGGRSVVSIANDFYAAGVQFSSLTGFSASMTNADFVNLVYRNVLGRPEGADAGGLSYWTGELASGAATRGSLVDAILNSAHTFKGHATFGFVADLLDNKIAVAKQVAVDWGVNYNTAAESIAQGMAVAKAITPSSTEAALTLVGIAAGQVVLGG